MFVVPAEATNTSKEVKLRVTLHDGTVLDGRLRFKKTRLEVKAGKTRKLLYREISSIGMIPGPDRDKKNQAGRAFRRQFQFQGEFRLYLLNHKGRGKGNKIIKNPN